MIVLGLLLILLALGAGALLYLGATSLTGDENQLHIHLLGGTLTVPPIALLLAGAGVVLLVWLGWGLLRLGGRRRARRRRLAKEEEQLARTRAAARERELLDERDRLTQETQSLRQQADNRAREQQLATDTARRRAEVAEQQLREHGRG